MPWRNGLVNENTSALPTKKLTAAALASVVLFLLSLLTDIDENTEQAVNVLVPLVLAYFVRNDPTPGGVPTKNGV